MEGVMKIKKLMKKYDFFVKKEDKKKHDLICYTSMYWPVTTHTQLTKQRVCTDSDKCMGTNSCNEWLL